MSEKIGLAIRIWREREKPVWIVYADARTSYLYIYTCWMSSQNHRNEIRFAYGMVWPNMGPSTNENQWMKWFIPDSVAKWISVRTIRKWTNDEWTAINILATNSTYWVWVPREWEIERCLFCYALFSLVFITKKQTNNRAKISSYDDVWATIL